MTLWHAPGDARHRSIADAKRRDCSAYLLLANLAIFVQQQLPTGLSRFGGGGTSGATGGKNLSTPSRGKKREKKKKRRKKTNMSVTSLPRCCMQVGLCCTTYLPFFPPQDVDIRNIRTRAVASSFTPPLSPSVTQTKSSNARSRYRRDRKDMSSLSSRRIPTE